MGTFLPFRVYNTDNQLIIHSAHIIAGYPVTDCGIDNPQSVTG